MKKFPLIASAIATLALTPSISYAWNSQGHITVAEIAYQNLNESAREQVDLLADKAFNSMPEAIQQKMNAYQGASKFAKLAAAPDWMRKIPAEQVWQQMDETIPAALTQWDEKATGAWHYINLTYPVTSQCDFVHVPNIKLVGNELYQSFKADPQAASLMFMSHIAGDTHQPMHTVAQSISKTECISDLGGNRHTLNIVQKDLHHLWDSGMGLLDEPHNIHDFTIALQNQYPHSTFELGNTADINLWLQESFELADFGYSVTIDTTPTPAYYRKGADIVRQRLSQAGYRLAEEINSVFPAK